MLTTWNFKVRSTSHSSTTSVVSFDEVQQVNATAQKEFIRVLDLDVQANTLYKDLDFGFAYTSFTFEVGRNTNFINAYFRTSEGERFSLDSIPSTDQPGSVRRSPFIIPNYTQRNFTFFSGEIQGKLRLYLFYAPPLKHTLSKKHGKASDACDKPELVRGVVWRSGLPEPSGQREKHAVAHNVVHHAASSNSNHDYMNVVRNIFLLHTQSNGWDDIGYNFVIAQDGTIFEGREHQEIDSTDNIKGAHFCGKNSNTMGVCMLGNFEETAPSSEALASLTHLLAWKCFKDDILPTGSSKHPTSTSPLLAHIAGHRDGCATACPGDSLYQVLPKVINDVDSMVKACKPASSEVQLGDDRDIVWYYSQTRNALELRFSAELEISDVQVVGLDGKRVAQTSVKPGATELSMGDLKTGMYHVLFETRDGRQYARKIWIGG